MFPPPLRSLYLSEFRCVVDRAHRETDRLEENKSPWLNFVNSSDHFSIEFVAGSRNGKDF